MAKIKINIKLKKKTLLILIPVVVLLLAGIVGTTVFMMKKKSAAEKPAAPPAYYVSKKEGLSSITAIVGDRPFEDLALAEKEQAKIEKKAREEAEKEAKKEAKKAEKEAKKEAKKAKKEAKEKKEEDGNTEEPSSSETAEALDTAAETAAEEEEIAEDAAQPADKYRYFDVEDANKDVQDYISYLKSERNFIEIQERDSKKKDETSKDGKEEDVAESFRFAGPADSSDAYLTVTIEKEKDSYIITASEGNEPWNTYLPKLWNEQTEAIKQAQKKADDPKTSREEAEETVSELSQEELGLPEPSDQYEFITAVGLMSLNGKSYYPVRAYKRQPDDSLWFVGTYLMDYDSKTVPYKYDEATGSADPIG